MAVALKISQSRELNIQKMANFKLFRLFWIFICLLSFSCNDPQSLEQSLSSAHEEFQSGNFEGALLVADSIIQVDSLNLEALSIKCKAMFFLNQATEALPYAAKRCKISPQNREYKTFFDELKHVASFESRISESSSFYQEVMNKTEDYWYFTKEWFRCYEIENKIDSAAFFSRKALEIDNTCCQCVFDLIDYFNNQGQKDSVEKYLEMVQTSCE
ncbi:MAG: hypothetical protein ACKVOK_10925 [Flavobacteriales bacterium]